MSDEQPLTTYPVKQFQICLPKLKLPELPLMNDNVPCFGCSQNFKSEDQCMEHILHECSRIKSFKKDTNIQSDVVSWIFDYYQKRSSRSNNTGIMKTSVIQQTCCKITNNTCYCNLQVVLTPIPKSLMCPVCEKYFCSSKACCTHLFRVCLFTENYRNAITAENFLSQSLFNDVKKSTAFEEISIANTGIPCKYCKMKLPDEEQLKNHFATEHHHINDVNHPTCKLCNFRASSEDKLISHFFGKHVKCSCGTKSINYSNMRYHFNLCSKGFTTTCPICKEMKINLCNTEAEFVEHLLTCKRFLTLKIEVDDLLFECDICQEVILKSDADNHLAYHFKLNNSTTISPEPIFINLSDLRNALPDADFMMLQTACEG